MSLSTELLCAKEICRTIWRKPTKYWPLLPSLYGAAILAPGTAAVLRHGYAFMRHLDDVIDGDLPMARPVEYVAELQEKMIQDPICTEPKILRTFAYVVQHWQHSIDPREYFGSLIEVLLFDHERTQSRKALSAAELDRHYRRTFFPLIDFMFSAMDSQLHAADVPVLTYGQARWQCFRDFRQDWVSGKINVPTEILQQANLTPTDPLETVFGSPVIQAWFTETLASTRRDFRQLGIMFRNHPEQMPRLVLQFASWYFSQRIPELNQRGTRVLSDASYL